MNNDHLTGRYDVADKLLSTASCPYLGLAQDSATAMGFPSPANHCYGKKNGVPIATESQARLCLTEEYDTCPVYKEKVAREAAGSSSGARRWFGRLAILTPFILIFAASLVWWPDPGASIAEFTGYARSLTEIVEPGDNNQPALSQEIIVEKERVKPAVPQEPVAAEGNGAKEAGYTTARGSTDLESGLPGETAWLDESYRILSYDWSVR